MATPRKGNERDSYIVSLRRHMMGCTSCQGALAALHPDGMCIRGRHLTISAANEFFTLMEKRRRSIHEKSGIYYACPDVHAHGEAWFITAEPCHLTAVQGELF